MDKKSGGANRVSVSAPVWVTAAAEYFASELIDQAGQITADLNQPGGPRKRITVEDIIKALRTDTELDKAVTGCRILVGEKISGKKITKEISLAPKKKKDGECRGEQR